VCAPSSNHRAGDEEAGACCEKAIVATSENSNRASDKANCAATNKGDHDEIGESVEKFIHAFLSVIRVLRIVNPSHEIDGHGANAKPCSDNRIGQHGLVDWFLLTRGAFAFGTLATLSDGSKLEAQRIGLRLLCAQPAHFGKASHRQQIASVHQFVDDLSHILLVELTPGVETQTFEGQVLLVPVDFAQQAECVRTHQLWTAR
jgi:hypothetical protein